MDAANGKEGWVVLVVKDVNGRAEVVGNVNAKGMFRKIDWFLFSG